MAFFESENSAPFSRDKVLGSLIFAISAFVLTAVAINLFSVFSRPGKNVQPPTVFQDIKRVYAPLIKYYPGVVIVCAHLLVAAVVFWELYHWLDTQSEEGIKMDALTKKDKKYHEESMAEFHNQSVKMDQVIAGVVKIKKLVQGLSYQLIDHLQIFETDMSTEMNNHHKETIKITKTQAQKILNTVHDALNDVRKNTALVHDLRSVSINVNVMDRHVKRKIGFLTQRIDADDKKIENLRDQEERSHSRSLCKEIAVKKAEVKSYKKQKEDLEDCLEDIKGIKQAINLDPNVLNPEEPESAPGTPPSSADK